jgi:hypothetical protein
MVPGWCRKNIYGARNTQGLRTDKVISYRICGQKYTDETSGRTCVCALAGGYT